MVMERSKNRAIDVGEIFKILVGDRGVINFVNPMADTGPNIVESEFQHQFHRFRGEWHSLDLYHTSTGLEFHFRSLDNDNLGDKYTISLVGQQFDGLLFTFDSFTTLKAYVAEDSTLIRGDVPKLIKDGELKPKFAYLDGWKKGRLNLATRYSNGLENHREIVVGDTIYVPYHYADNALSNGTQHRSFYLSMLFRLTDGYSHKPTFRVKTLVGLRPEQNNFSHGIYVLSRLWMKDRIDHHQALQPADQIETHISWDGAPDIVVPPIVVPPITVPPITVPPIVVPPFTGEVTIVQPSPIPGVWPPTT